MSEQPELDILFEDNHCLALVKPAGWASAHYDGREETLDRAVKAYLKAKYAKPGNVFLGVVHRLDKPVSGVLLFARTSPRYSASITTVNSTLCRAVAASLVAVEVEAAPDGQERHRRERVCEPHVPSMPLSTPYFDFSRGRYEGGTVGAP